MTGMDMLLASLTQEQLVERAQADLVEANAEMCRAWDDFIRWIEDDLEKRIRE